MKIKIGAISGTLAVAKKRTPNANTVAAMKELKTGKGRKFKSVEDLFKSIKL